MRNHIIALAILGALTGCQTQAENTPRIAQLEEQITLLKQQQATLTDAIAEVNKVATALSKQRQEDSLGFRTRGLVVEDSAGRSVFWAGSLPQAGGSSGILISNPTANTHITLGLHPRATLSETIGQTPVRIVQFEELPEK